MTLPISIQMGGLPVQSPPTVQLWMQKEDGNSPTWMRIRGCAPCPAVFTLLDDPHVEITEQWQYAIRAWNYGMSVSHVAAIFDYTKAFCNGTGFGDSKDPRANYLTGENMGYPSPTFDKVRTCSRAVMTGNLAFSNRYLWVKMFDGKQPPPLKLGKKYPTRVEDANFEDYLYNPRDNREMFFVANIVKADGTVVQFPNGAVYPWMDDSPYTWLPLVSDYPVYYDVNELIKLPLGSTIPSPYRRS